MINLDFKFEPDAKGPGGQWPDFWVDECELGSFEGFQTFIVNGANFSSSVPILGFARTLKHVADNLMKMRVSEDRYCDLSSQWCLFFLCDGNQVNIFDHQNCAIVSLEEFYEAVQKYTKRAFDACVSMSPSILNNEFILAWWNNYNFSCAKYVPRKTDRNTLIPTNPFYQE